MTLNFSDFATADAGTYFSMASVGFSASIGVIAGSLVQVSATTPGTYKIDTAPASGGSFTIARTGTDVTCSYAVGAATGSLTASYSGNLGVAFKLINGSTVTTTGTLSVKLDDFAVIGTGISPDDFAANKIK